MAPDVIRLREQSSGSGGVARHILAALPSWFGIASSVDDYVAVADRSPTVIAATDREDVGFLTIVRHSPHAAEVSVMGVVPDRHRQGIGRQMLAHTEESLVETGVEYLQVKTLSPSRFDGGYARTRAFYAANGFRELERFPTLWGPENPALQMVKRL